MIIVNNQDRRVYNEWFFSTKFSSSNGSYGVLKFSNWVFTKCTVPAGIFKSDLTKEVSKL